MAEITPETVSTAALAYLGDSVTELWVRRRLVTSGISSAGKLNEMALGYVRATEQSAALKRMLPHLTEEEAAVFRCGKNIDHHSMPKSASQKEYREATGFETVFGYLYLKGMNDRIDELLTLAYSEEQL